jgi:hypothetical protein
VRWPSFGSSPSSLPLRSSYAGHASPFGLGVAAPRVARRAKVACPAEARVPRAPAFALWASAWQPSLASRAKAGGPGRTRTCNQTVMSGGISISFVDFAGFSFDFGRVHCLSLRSFLVRNWCGWGNSFRLNRFCVSIEVRKWRWSRSPRRARRWLALPPAFRQICSLAPACLHVVLACSQSEIVSRLSMQPAPALTVPAENSPGAS